MKTGRVKFFNEATGFGFIKADDVEQDIYFRNRDTIDLISEEDKVTFEVKEGASGLSAFDVKKVMFDLNHFLYNN